MVEFSSVAGDAQVRSLYLALYYKEVLYRFLMNHLQAAPIVRSNLTHDADRVYIAKLTYKTDLLEILNREFGNMPDLWLGR